MKKLTALILSIFASVFFFLFSSKAVLAAPLFQDDFEDGNYNGWTVHGGSWTVKEISGSKRFGTKVIPTSTVVESTAGSVSWTDYIYELDMVALDGADKNIIFRVIDANNKYEVHMVSGYNTICLGRWINGSYWDTCKYWPFSNGIIYHLKAVLLGTSIKFYVNDQLAIDFNDTGSSITSGKIGLRVGTGAVAPSEVYFDNILVTSLEPSPTPTPTLQPLILLPGFGASWNHEAIILGSTDKQPEDWYMTPGVKAYDGLIQTIENAGYIRGNNFFVFNYDWRKPVEEIVDDLEGFLSRHPPPEETEINLVGHSAGGLIARTYVQENPEAEVDKLITLGSPHKGVPKVYYLWEGAQLNKAHPTWQRVTLGILLQLYKENFENNVETIQGISPSLKDLLPTFPYLKRCGAAKPLSEMNERNLWLENLNTPPLPESLTSILNTFVGLNSDTLRFINIKERGLFDQILGRWIDGKPTGEEYEMGDDTILSESARLEPADATELPGINHRNLVASETSQQEIMDALGLSPTEIALIPEVDYEPSLVFQLASPVNMTIYGPDGWQIGQGVTNNIPDGIYSPHDKLIIIPNPKTGEYEARITPEDGGGPYRLLIGKITEQGDIWTETGGEVTTGETKTHKTSFTQDVKKEKLELIILAKKRLEEANKIARSLRNPRGTFISGLLRIPIEQLNLIIRLFRKNLENYADIYLKQTLISLSKTEDSLGRWGWLYPIPPETESEIRGLIKEAKDYLLQAYDLE